MAQLTRCKSRLQRHLHEPPRKRRYQKQVISAPMGPIQG
jgi:hypothetical protein